MVLAHQKHAVFWGLQAPQTATNDLFGSKHIFLKTLDKSLSNACGPTCLSPIAFEYRFFEKKSILTGAFPFSPVPRYLQIGMLNWQLKYLSIIQESMLSATWTPLISWQLKLKSSTYIRNDRKNLKNSKKIFNLSH